MFIDFTRPDLLGYNTPEFTFPFSSYFTEEKSKSVVMMKYH